jgi:hypothetical protein
VDSDTVGDGMAFADIATTSQGETGGRFWDMSKRLLIFTLTAFFVLGLNSVLAQPSVNSVSGVISHKENITIRGANFGLKSPARPLWWDDGEGAILNERSIMTSGEMSWAVSGVLSGSNKHYNDVAPTFVTQDGGIANMMYRTTGYRNVAAPHSRSSTFLAGGHDDQGECLGGEVGQNVALNVSDGTAHDEWYISYYLTLDPRWPAWVYQNNYKEFNWEASPPYTIYHTNNYESGGACGGGHNDLRRAPQCGEDWQTLVIVQFMDISFLDSRQGFYPVITHDTNVNNPSRQWVRVERVLDRSADFYQVLHDNVAMLDSNRDSNFRIRLHNGTAIGGVTMGGFWKGGMCGNNQDDLDDDAWRYFDDVYVDNTFSRVVLTDNQTYSNSNMVEPQIPMSWSDGSITVMVNQGALPEGQAFLFVFDAGNNHNPVGFPITIGGSGGGGEVTPIPRNRQPVL